MRLVQHPALGGGQLWLGIWDCDQSVGFALYSIQAHEVLATLLAMPTYALTPCPPRHVVVYDDIDTRYGLHGYTYLDTPYTPEVP